MAAPNSDTDICQMAIDLLGHGEKINSISSPTTATEALMARHYDASRQRVLRMYPWHFATAMAQISRIGTPLSDYRDEYQLPADFIRLLSVGGQIEEWQRHNYRINGSSLLINNSLPTGISPTIYNVTETTTDVTVVTGQPPDQIQTETITTTITGTLNPPGQINTGITDASTINIRYIFNEININNWVPDAKYILAYEIAINTGYAIIKQEDRISSLVKLQMTIIPDAYAVDGQENSPKRIEHSKAIYRRRCAVDTSTVASPYTIFEGGYGGGY